MTPSTVTLDDVIADTRDIVERQREFGFNSEGYQANVIILQALKNEKDRRWQSMDSAPKDGNEILIRYPLQQNVKELARWDTIHKRWLSKGEVIFPHNQQCEWHPLPSDTPPTTAGG